MVESVSEMIQKVSPYYKKKGGPEAEHTLKYDSFSEGLEPIYFFISDLMSDYGFKTEKLVDNFTSSPGSGHFGDLTQRASILQQQGSKLLGDINMVIKSVLNLIYDLRDFRMRLDQYTGLKSKNKQTQNAALLSLKQIWMDKVDALKGNSSIKAMGLGQAQFVTLIDAFLMVRDEKDVNNLDLNEVTKRILKPRVQEFNVWVKESERELRKRYELEKNYLKSQVNSLKLYSRWAKPYLKAAQQLEQKDLGRSPDLVKTFNTIILELSLFGKSKVDIKSSAQAGDLPEHLARPRFLRNIKRDYFVCILVDFYFRGIPRQVAQQSHYGFGGKTTVSFKAYVLNSDELKKLEQEFSKSDLADVLGLIEGSSGESLTQLQKEIDEFLNEKEDKEESEKKSKEANPFMALIGVYEKKSKPKEKKKEDSKKPVKPDNWLEANVIRPFVKGKAVGTAFDLFNIYKKAHGMPTYI